MPDHRPGPDPAEMAELRQFAVRWTAPAECQCDECERARFDRLRALSPSQLRGIDPEDMSDDAFERYLPERRPR